jgi:hypothetical protein
MLSGTAILIADIAGACLIVWPRAYRRARRAVFLVFVVALFVATFAWTSQHHNILATGSCPGADRMLGGGAPGYPTVCAHTILGTGQQLLYIV